MATDTVMHEPLEVDTTFDIEIYNKDNNLDFDMCVKGDDGRGVFSTKIQYLAGTSPTEIPVGDWSDTIVEVEQGQYLWQKITYTYTDDSEYITYLNVYRAKDGDFVNSVTMQYQQGNNSTTIPTGTWSDTFITVDPGKFLWTKIAYTFTNGDTEYQYIPTYMGDNGATFIPYIDEDGVIHWTNDKGLVNPTAVNIKGPKGDTGERGYCPSASVEKVGSVATITITDLEGTTTATVADGTGDMSKDEFVYAGGTGVVLNSQAVNGYSVDNTAETDSIWTSDKILSETTKTYYGSTTPSGSLGKNGDIYILIEDLPPSI